MAHMESPSLLAARQRWHRARAAYEEAAATHQADAETAAVAVEAWLGLVRVRVSRDRGRRRTPHARHHGPGRGPGRARPP